MGVLAWAMHSLVLLVAAGGSVAMMIPVSESLECDEPRKRRGLTIYTILLAACGLTALVMSLLGAPGATGVAIAFAVGLFVFSLLGNVNW